MKVYVLQYDTDHGHSEEWNVFYTPMEVFDSREAVDARIAFLEKQINDDEEPCGYEFQVSELELFTIADASAPHRDQADE
jgi:hypothetical protein